MNGIHWTHISCADKTSCFSKLHGLFFEEGKKINPSCHRRYNLCQHYRCLPRPKYTPENNLIIIIVNLLKSYKIVFHALFVRGQD